MEEHQLLLVSLVIAFGGVWLTIGLLSLTEEIGKTRSRRLQSQSHHAAHALGGPHGPAASQPPRKLSRTRANSSAS